MVEKRKLVLVFAIILSSTCLLAMILSIIGYSNSSTGSTILSDIYNNHRKIVNVSVTDNCRNIQNEYFSNAYFEGTDDGCYCGTWSITKGTCSSSSRKKGCYTVLQVASKKLQVWKRTNDICLNNDVVTSEKVEKMSLFDRIFKLQSTVESNYEFILRKYGKSSSEQCPPLTNECGVLDSLGNKLCYPYTKNCPINDIVVDKESTFKKIGYEKLNLKSSNDEKIYYTNKDTKGPIVVEMKASEGKMCLDPNYYEGLGNGYNLDTYFYQRVATCPEVEGSKIKYNSNYKFVDSNNKYDTYADNGVLALLQRLPYYPISSLNSKYFNLYYRNYIGWDLTCLKQGISPSNLDYYYNVSTNNSSLHYATMVMSIIAFCFALCTFAGMYENGEICFNIIGLVPWALCLTCGILMSKIKSLDMPPSIINCMDKEMITLLNYTNSNSNTADWYSTILCFFNFGVVIFLVFTCYFICCKDNETKTYVSDEINSNTNNNYNSGGFISSSNDAVDSHNNYNQNNFYNNPYDNNNNNNNYNNNNFNSGGFIQSSNDAFDTNKNYNTGGFIPASNEPFLNRQGSTTEYPGLNDLNQDNNRNNNFNNNFDNQNNLRYN